MKKIICVLLSLIILCSFTACRSEGNVTPKGRMNEANGLSKTVSELACALLQNADTENGENLHSSPISLLYCLALLANGAGGETLSAIEDELGCDIDTLNTMLSQYKDSLNDSADAKFNVANSVWIKENEVRLKDSYLNAVKGFYGAEIYSEPFDNVIIDKINGWCNEKTDGMIPEFLSEMPIDAVTVLLNAVCFDALWRDGYDEADIERRNFNNLDGTISKVNMLCSEESYYIKADGVKGFIKDYKGERFKLVALLPDDIKSFVSSLDGDKWLDIIDSAEDEKVAVRMPEFEGETELDLKKTLTKMGLGGLFLDSADLSKMSDTPLALSQAKQKTYMKLFADGTKAAAVTGMIIRFSSAVIEKNEVYLDRPFVYAIIDGESSLPLFMGVVNDL